jgi:SEC-C motif
MTHAPSTYSGESVARSATDQLAVPDDDDPPKSCLLDGQFSTAGLLGGGCGSTEDDDSAADFRMGHGGPCSGENRRDAGSIQIATAPSSSRRPGWEVKVISRSATCSCGSGKKFKKCCWDKGFEWIKSTPTYPVVAEVFQQQQQMPADSAPPCGAGILTGPSMSPALTSRFKWYPNLPGNRHMGRSNHVLMMCAFVIFVVVHVAMMLPTGFAGNLNHIVGTSDSHVVGVLLGLVGIGVVVTDAGTPAPAAAGRWSGPSARTGGPPAPPSPHRPRRRAAGCPLSFARSPPS